MGDRVLTFDWSVQLADPALSAAVAALRDRLAGAGWSPADGTEARVAVLWTDRPDVAAEALGHHDPARPLLLAGPTLACADVEGRLAEAAGVIVGTPTPVHDVRVRAGSLAATELISDHPHTGWAHLGAHVHVRDRVLRVDKAADDVEVLYTANVSLAEHAVAAWRPSTGTGIFTLGSEAAAASSPALARLLVQTLRRLGGLTAPRPVRVGLLGYGAIGHEHSRAVAAVPGLELTAVCDASSARREAALAHSPAATAWADADSMLDESELDLVVVSTPPQSHATWALRAVQSGRHVVVEKPFALRTEEADAVLAAAREHRRLAVVYQNRRFDPDHLALRRLVREGALGEVFHLEAFVGGYGHPCNLWHSDEEVSGGAFYDWGAHVLDQVLDLVDVPIEHVTAATHKRMWFDVTNADHARVSLRFSTGAEAEFVYSDLAAALKPRWYVLGTRGAVVGSWRVERVVTRSDVGTLLEDVLAPADAPPVLDLHAADGSVTRVATPSAAPYAFHAELAEHLLLGLPMSVTGAQSRRVLAVMEAAAESARDGGRPVVPR